MMTRKAVANSTELKLRQALQELKASKDTCNQLLREREDSEKEIKKIIDKNSQLKSELAQLHSEHVEALVQRDQLRDTLQDYNQQLNTYESALSRITDLEKELIAANQCIAELEATRQSQEEQHTKSLFEELMLSPGVCLSPQPLENNVNSINKLKCKLGHKKIKKYIRISKFIKKTEKLIKRNNCYHKNIALRKERIDLIDSLDIYSTKLIESRQMYDQDTKSLQSNIKRLHESLEFMKNQYSSAQIQINEHIQSATELVELCNYNANRYDSLVQNQSNATFQHTNCSCTCVTQHSDSSNLKNSVSEHTLVSHNEKNINKIESNYNTVTFKPVSNKNCHTIMYSDKIGQGFGSIINDKTNKKCINICTPGQSLNKIINNINESHINDTTNLIILCGDSSNLTKQDILRNINILLTLQSKTSCRIILSALPYASNLNWDQNRRIYDLNLYMYNLICRHSDVILYFDVNKFINNFILTPDTMYLSKKIRIELANLLAYNLQDSVTNYVTKLTIPSLSTSTNSRLINVNKTVTNSDLN